MNEEKAKAKALPDRIRYAVDNKNYACVDPACKAHHDAEYVHADALTTARREAREEAFRDAIGAARSVILPPPLRETRNLIVEAIEAVEATQKGDTDA